MSWTALFLIAMLLLFLLLLLGEWIAFGLGTVGLTGLFLVSDGFKHFETLSLIAWNSTNSFEYTAIPLFIFMGEVLVHSDLSRRFYAAAVKWFGRMPGGLLQTNIISCAIFAAICGSSPATASAIGSVSYREMMEHRYNKSMIIGSLAGGGALGILIPPSITMIIYGAIVETSVEKLFIAGVVPGILAAVMFIFFIAIACMIKKDFCPPKPARPSFVEMMKALVQMSPFFILILIVLGSIYAGFATTTEAAALGALGAVICSLAVKGLNWEKLKIALNATIKNTTMIMILVVCAKVLSYFVVISGISRELTSWIVAVNPSKPLFLLIITVMYLILGCIMDGASMMYITIPVLLPMLTAMGFDLTWFGVLMVVLVELSMITPPVGLNLYVLHGVCNNLGIPTSFGEVVNGSVPYCLLYLLLAFILMLFPQLALWLPGIM